MFPLVGGKSEVNKVVVKNVRIIEYTHGIKRYGIRCPGSWTCPVACGLAFNYLCN